MNRVETIEGRRTLVVERTPPLPAALATLLEGGRDHAGRYWSRLAVTRREPLRLGGARAACLADDHRLRLWLEGLFAGSDGLTRSLRLNACADCGAVCVRDVSSDSLAAYDPAGHGEVRPARRPLRRKDHVIGWYSGARPGQRVYS